MLHLIAAGPEALERARSAAARAGSEARLALSQITYRIPVERPDKIISIGTNYMKHLWEMRPDFQEPPYPAMFLRVWRSEEHTSELQSLMRISYAVFCLKKKTNKRTYKSYHI